MKWMGEYLHHQGYTCLGIRLAGHGTHPEDMIRSQYTDWIASVEDGYHSLCGITDNIFLAGLSMGGILALLMSTQLKVKGVVGMSTPYRLPRDYPIWLLQAISNFVEFRPKSSEKPGNGWFDKKAYQEHISYPQNPVRSTAELKKLILEMRAALPKVKIPVLLIHSKNDTYVLPENMEHIYAGLVNAQDKTKLYIKGAGHVVTQDAARERVFESTVEFIQRIESSRGPS